MNTTTSLSLSNMGVEIDTSSDVFGELRPSAEFVGDGQTLRQRMAEDGYLYLPGCLNRGDVLQVRREMLELLQSQGMLNPAFPLMEGVCRPEKNVKIHEDQVANCAALRKVLYEGPLMEIVSRFFNEPVRYFDYTWFRSMSHGRATPPHCDLVFMGRGTRDLVTAWVPYGEVPKDLGGLMLLEGSHKVTPRLRADYLEKDVDTYCTNRPAPETPAPNHWLFDGALSHDPVEIRNELGGRWLTTEYQPGDVILFGMAMVHAGMDNQTNRIRLSSDSRYQRASEPVDERWVGEHPPGHGPHVHRGVIC